MCNQAPGGRNRYGTTLETPPAKSNCYQWFQAHERSAPEHRGAAQYLDVSFRIQFAEYSCAIGSRANSRFSRESPALHYKLNVILTPNHASAIAVYSATQNVRLHRRDPRRARHTCDRRARHLAHCRRALARYFPSRARRRHLPRRSTHRRPPDSAAPAPRNRPLHHGQNYFRRARQSLSAARPRRR